MDNLSDILNEISVYIYETNNILARKSIEILGTIASRIKESI